MSRILAQVTIPYTTGTPSDVSVNTWAFDTGAGGVGEVPLAAIVVGLGEFYEAVDELYSELIGSTFGYKLYDVDEPEPRTPLVVGEGPWLDPGTNPLPEEVAVCLSFRGLYASGSPPARRRGRVYIGPLGVTAAGELSGRSAPAAVVETALAAGVLALDGAIGPNGVTHCVWSRADDAFYPVVDYWMDNAWDTQRRRGVAPTNRIDLTP